MQSDVTTYYITDVNMKIDDRREKLYNFSDVNMKAW